MSRSARSAVGGLARSAVATCEVVTCDSTCVDVIGWLAAACWVDNAGTPMPSDPRTRMRQSHHYDARGDISLACTTGPVPSCPLHLHSLDELLLEGGRPVAAEAVSRCHPLLAQLVHAAQRLAAQPHQVCPGHVAVVARGVGEAVSVCRPRH